MTDFYWIRRKRTINIFCNLLGTSSWFREYSFSYGRFHKRRRITRGFLSHYGIANEIPVSLDNILSISEIKPGKFHDFI